MQGYHGQGADQGAELLRQLNAGPGSRGRWCPHVIRSVTPEFVWDKAVWSRFIEELEQMPHEKARTLAHLLRTEPLLKAYTWRLLPRHLHDEEVWLVMIFSTSAQVLEQLGEQWTLPRGFPIIWQPQARMSFEVSIPSSASRSCVRKSTRAGWTR
eukprot:TRINITY_DN3031_c1_g1_i3.p1 TRINITY_DN3031_c1_g1~~TRINITY_DN3031_c1_g1_i3.p1  ORF type:complete len:155 (+),score=13.20 TRINITY_DN3031_c1_g1_i3:268-732(+)